MSNKCIFSSDNALTLWYYNLFSKCSNLKNTYLTLTCLFNLKKKHY